MRTGPPNRPRLHIARHHHSKGKCNSNSHQIHRKSQNTGGECSVSIPSRQADCALLELPRVPIKTLVVALMLCEYHLCPMLIPTAIIASGHLPDLWNAFSAECTQVRQWKWRLHRCNALHCDWGLRPIYIAQYLRTPSTLCHSRVQVRITSWGSLYFCSKSSFGLATPIAGRMEHIIKTFGHATSSAKHVINRSHSKYAFDARRGSRPCKISDLR